jgi:pimeloyl-ACP methyl ester carboxylesterase
MTAAFQLILLPGLGADERLFAPQQAAFPQLRVPKWIPPRKRESLACYADRMAEDLASSIARPLVLGGVSLGGMVAYEMARRLKPDLLVLIATCRTRRGLRGMFRVGRVVLSVLPVGAWSVAQLLAGPVVRSGFGLPADKRQMAISMFREADARFMQWALDAILRWNPTPTTETRTLQIHGGRDLLIPAARVDADHVIPDGGHLINMTHADEVNQLLRAAAPVPRHS